MRKYLLLCVIVCAILLLFSCSKTNTVPPDNNITTSPDNSAQNSSGIPNYEKFLDSLKCDETELHYYIRDIDGNGIDELITPENTNYSIYTFEDSVKKIG